jgi:hypothetical protein
MTLQQMKLTTRSPLVKPVTSALFVAAVLSVALQPRPTAAAAQSAVDFRFAPPEWQTSICLPDDPHKTLVDRSGELLYHYGQGGREFATRVGVQVVPGAVWQKQELLSPRVPIVRTYRAANGLSILEEAFAATNLRQPRSARPSSLRRTDGAAVNRNWASPPVGVSPALADIAVHMGGSIGFEASVPSGETRRIALALCEGWWSEPGQRVQILRIEGAEPVTVDTVADLGKNKPGLFWFEGKDADGDGVIRIDVDAAPAAADKNTILNGLWVFPATMARDSSAVLSGSLNTVAIDRMHSGNPGGPARNDLILVRVANTDATARVLKPRLTVETTLPFNFVRGTERFQVNDHETITASLRMIDLAEDQKGRRVIQLEDLTVPAGKTATFFVLYSGGGSIVLEPDTLKQALACRKRAVAYWEKAPLPYDRVQVPDAGIQALVDSSIRNIWQAREIKKGLPAFQVGPTCYRGLWIVDGAFLLEAAGLLGAGKEARSGVAYELTFQQPDGRIKVMDNFSKENGIVLWTCVRHAQLTQDKAWLEGLWPRLERIAAHIKALRRETLTNVSPRDDGLLPAGFPDGGIGGVMDEYTNPYWNLAGLHAFIQAAQWLGKDESRATWQREYDDFMAAFRRAAERDIKADAHGNRYVPIRMDGQDLPQRGQWSFCHAVYPGQIFPQEEPLVASTLAMLERTEREGMVYGTGWDATGIWNYFASFYGHAWLWQGNGRKAAQALTAFANHAAPTLLWREEQSLKGEKFRKVGDMPHNWASAEFIRLTVHLLALDRGDELHLLEGLPPEWLGPGMTTRLKGIATPFGSLEMTLQADNRGGKATLSVKPVGANCKAVVVHLPSGDTRRLDPRKGGTIVFSPQSGTGETPEKLRTKQNPDRRTGFTAK